jgi:hypothetical protein
MWNTVNGGLCRGILSGNRWELSEMGFCVLFHDVSKGNPRKGEYTKLSITLRARSGSLPPSAKVVMLYHYIIFDSITD